MDSNSHLEEIAEITKQIKNTENSYKNNIPQHKEATSILYNARTARSEAERDLINHLRNHKNNRSKFKNNEIENLIAINKKNINAAIFL